MTHTLISFLGRGASDRGRRYRTATYEFGDGRRRTTEFFGLALAEEVRPDRLLVLGTTGSMWDVLLVSLGLGAEHDDALYALTEAADQDRVRQTALDELAGPVGERLGLPVLLRLIPYGRDGDEQLNILTGMAECFEPGDRASLDVTHGLRHLPMLTQLSALYLRAAKDVSIEGVYYGALDMTRDGLTPVMDLRGLLRLADWIGALHAFDKDGDYGVFAGLLAEDLPAPVGDALEEAAFFERGNRVGQARGRLRVVESALDRQGLGGVGRLFEATLRRRIGWCHQDRLYQRQRALAVQNLERGDFLRAALFAYESFITLLVQRAGESDPENGRVREQVKSGYRERHRPQRPWPAEFRDFEQLRELRNQLAHGTKAHLEEVQQAMAGPATMRALLGRLIARLLPEQG